MPWKSSRSREETYFSLALQPQVVIRFCARAAIDSHDPPDSHENTIECAYTRDRDMDRGSVYIGQLYTDRRVRDANMHLR